MIRTGSQYIDSIRDGREVYLNGERIKDVSQRASTTCSTTRRPSR